MFRYHVTIIDDLNGGEDLGGIISDSTLGMVKIGGDLNEAVIIAEGLLLDAPGAKQSSALAIKGVQIAGSVFASRILAGYDIAGFASNADATIGAVKVIGDWIASDLVAGVADTDANGFGSDDDALFDDGQEATIIAKIASITIGGMILGADGGGQFGFVAEEIGVFKMDGTALALSKTANDNFPLGLAGEVRVREYRPII